MSGTVRAFRRLLGIPLGLALVALAGGPGALAAGPDAVVGDAALAYARGLDEFLTQMPEEAERVGLDLATVAELDVATTHHVFALDDRFGDTDDNRDIDAARVKSSDLWWAVLEDAKGSARLQVSVRWAGGQAVPEVVGMNWMDADDIQQWRGIGCMLGESRERSAAYDNPCLGDGIRADRDNGSADRA